MERTEKFYTDMDEVFGPVEAFSYGNFKNKWRILPYRVKDFSGKMLVSNSFEAEDIGFDPKLCGWYKIYVGLMANSTVAIKLSSESVFNIYQTSPMPREYSCGKTIEECLWKCADMTGESVVLTKKMWAEVCKSNLASLRFVPMSDAEVSEYKAELERKDTLRIYATDDMHNCYFLNNLQRIEDWDHVILKYENSDVEWISLEDIRLSSSGKALSADLDELYFERPGDRRVQEQVAKFDHCEVLKHLVSLGHEKGYKMSVSLRMGAWGMGYPYDCGYFDSGFEKEKPGMHCIDRNGEVFSSMSYAYPKIRKLMVDTLLRSAESGCDAVTLIAHRGIPYVLFEKPVADRFFELYGEYPYDLPLDEPRLNKIHCEYMTLFARELRSALDDKFGKNKVKIHLRSIYSIFDTKYIGIDVEQWAKEGLIDTVIEYPIRHYEYYDGDIWQEGKDFRIDIDKYTQYVSEKGRASNCHLDHDVFYPFLGPYVNYRGEICGPKTEQERISEWNKLEKDYGVKVYIELMPRILTNEEFKKWALDLYGMGVERFGLWDSCMRVWLTSMWKTLSKIGHKEELADMDVASHRKLYKVIELGDYHIGRYSPTWGG